MTTTNYPIRINKYLFENNICSRRQADRYIKQGLVYINGKVAKLGEQVQKTDKVTLDEQITQEQTDRIYILFNKPPGVVSHNPQHGEKEAKDFFGSLSSNLAPLGRLDKASHGLMLFSNDGTIVNKVLNPQYEHEKEYEITVDKRIDKHFIQNMEKGVRIESYTTKPSSISKLAPRKFSIILTEGKKHQIRRMCAALGYQVLDLKRTRIHQLKLGSLKRGEYRTLTNKERDDFLRSLG